ncbi:MAG TPA: hypothetical protein DDZ51_02655 [Planctomycetaceae bacterium]|nr:hypothetical protein [Planctomycetaceae bacterium]
MFSLLCCDHLSPDNSVFAGKSSPAEMHWATDCVSGAAIQRFDRSAPQGKISASRYNRGVLKA